eukprot:GEZU01027919.1.p1 GENE.GEZU01027919.1~~GEZU01027919.1.p1  ORF type:complete len:800 (-),score=232.88 GEZU01027919.1:129-2492(-)
MLKWVGDLLWGKGSKNVDILGKFYNCDASLTHAKCLFLRAHAKIDHKPNDDYEQKLVVMRDEEEDVHEGEPIGYQFVLDETLQFSRISNAPKGSVAYCWRDNKMESWYVFELAQSGNVEATARLFQGLACECIFENTNQMPASEAPQQGIDAMCGTMTINFDLETLTPLPTKRPVNATPIKQEPQGTSQTQRQTPGALKSLTTTPSGPKVKSVYPTAPSLDDLDQPVLEYDEEEELSSARCDLYLYDTKIGKFVIREVDVTASICQVNDPKDYLYALFIEKDDERLMTQIINSSMQLQVYNTHHSIIWTMPEPLHIWSLVFKDERELPFKRQLNMSLYEACMQQPFSKVKAEDRDWILNATLMDPVQTDVQDDGYTDVDMLDFVETESEEEEEEEEQEKQAKARKGERNQPTPSTKNTLLADSYKHHRAFVVNGTNIGVFKHDTTDNDAIYVNTIKNIATLNKKKFSPKQIMLHHQDDSLLLLNPDQDNEDILGKVFKLDLNRGEVVEEWGTGGLVPVNHIKPLTKYAQQKPESTFVALNANTIFAMDPRLNNDSKIVGNIADLESRSKPGFTCATTSEDGFLAVGSKKGELRLYSGTPGVPRSGKKTAAPKTAKTLLPGFGDPIRGVDVTANGQWIVATCKTYLMAIPTTIPDSETTGFQERMGKDKPLPRRLQLLPEDVKLIGDVNFTPASFNMGVDGETWIVTSTGPYIITWNFRKVRQNHLQDYTIKKLREEVVDEQFVAVSQSSHGSDAPIICALAHDVRLETRVHTKKNPYRSKPIDSMYK